MPFTEKIVPREERPSQPKVFGKAYCQTICCMFGLVETIIRGTFIKICQIRKMLTIRSLWTKASETLIAYTVLDDKFILELAIILFLTHC
jgi:hypothetical protein